MSYITKAQVEAKRTELKAINKKFGVKAIFSGGNSSSLTLTIQGGDLDFITWQVDRIKATNINMAPYFGVEYHRTQTIDRLLADKNFDINHYSIDDLLDGKHKDYLIAAYAVMKDGHYDNSGSQTDYFDQAWYIKMKVGKWNKPFQFSGE